jgi:hypothetical protein
MIRSTITTVALTFAWLAAAPAAEEPVTKVKGYVVAVGETTLTIANLPIGAAAGGGHTFVMAAPKEGAADAKKEGGEAPTWVADSSAKPDQGAAGPGKPGTMRMVTGSAAAKLELTEVSFAKGAVKAADFPADTAVEVTYRTDGPKKRLERIDRAPQPWHDRAASAGTRGAAPDARSLVLGMKGPDFSPAQGSPQALRSPAPRASAASGGARRARA